MLADFTLKPRCHTKEDDSTVALNQTIIDELYSGRYSRHTLSYGTAPICRAELLDSLHPSSNRTERVLYYLPNTDIPLSGGCSETPHAGVAN